MGHRHAPEYLGQVNRFIGSLAREADPKAVRLFEAG